jgi:hypothetical protein
MCQKSSPGGNSGTFFSARGFTKKPCCADGGEDKISKPGINTAKSFRFISQTSCTGGAVARAYGSSRNPFLPNACSTAVQPRRHGPRARPSDAKIQQKLEQASGFQFSSGAWWVGPSTNAE